MPIRCEIVSQDRMVFEGDADMVILPGEQGVMGILPHHAPLLGTLQYGVIVVRRSGEEDYFTVSGGVAEVLPDRVTILADAAENVEEIDTARAEAAKERAEELLRNREIVEDAERYLAIQAALRRSNLRLDASRRYRRRQQPRRTL